MRGCKQRFCGERRRRVRVPRSDLDDKSPRRHLPDIGTPPGRPGSQPKRGRDDVVADDVSGTRRGAAALCQRARRVPALIQIPPPSSPPPNLLLHLTSKQATKMTV